MRNVRNASVLAIMTFLSLGLAQSITLSDGSTMDSIDAQVMCKDQVKDSLVAPSTAKFVGVWGGNSNQPVKFGNSWVYDVVVDSQNGFGAMLRSTIRCTLDGDNDSIGLEQLD